MTPARGAPDRARRDHDGYDFDANDIDGNGHDLDDHDCDDHDCDDLDRAPLDAPLRRSPMTSPDPTRRTLLTAAAALAAAPAAAQVPFNTLFNAGSSVIRAMQMSEPDELALGRDLYRPLLQESGGVYANRKVQSAIQRFAAPLFATSARRNFQWEIAVVDDNSVNAWALPAGKIAINKGLVRYTETEHELAAVVAHEIGHAELSHQIQAMRRENFTQAMTAAGRDIVASQLRGPGGALTSAGIDALRAPMHAMIRTGYGRDAEREADAHILAVFRSTGHDPAGAPAFFRTMLQLVPPGSEATTSLFSTHPGTQERIANLERAGAGLPRGAGSRATATAFAELKETFPTRRSFRRNIG
ncbi:MAG: M48 family metalloprotease [Phreatobacter sp.]|uniref:M48 family metalloprotease n=1 Tax=Phreatobacter sp. TaxID=1966341 RepID=UPI001A4E5AE2|nr:M48 family metalloprotease [Phreatobacter sp.]MBL8571869.1 M48 family metalloprotease [Phreatobacter sp.]